MKKLMYLLFVATLFFTLTSSGCKKEDSNPVDPGPTDYPPNFNLTAQPVTLVGGSEGLAFYAFCITDDVVMVSVRIRNPRGEQVTYNAGNTLVLKDQEFECQIPGTGYYKYLGTWTLTFVGNKATGTKSSFSVAKSLNVTGKQVPVIGMK